MVTLNRASNNPQSEFMVYWATQYFLWTVTWRTHFCPKFCGVCIWDHLEQLQVHVNLTHHQALSWLVFVLLQLSTLSSVTYAGFFQGGGGV